VDIKPQISSIIARCTSAKATSSARASCCSRSTSRADETLVLKAEAQLQKDLAALADAERQLARSKELLAQNFVSQTAVDTNQAAVDAQRAVVTPTVPRSRPPAWPSRTTASSRPTRGARASSTSSPARSCSPSSPPLVTITQLDPIAVAFNLPQRDLNDALQALRSGGGPRRRRCCPRPRHADRQARLRRQQRRRRSGTVKVKAVFDNKTEQLWPGAFVNVRLAVRTLKMRWSCRRPPSCQGARGPGRLRRRAGQQAAAARPVELGAGAGTEAVVTGVNPGRAGRRRRPAEPAAGIERDRAPGRRGRRHRQRRPRQQARRVGAGGRRLGRRVGHGALAQEVHMNLSELFIRRPVMTVLLNAAIVVAGIIAYGRIPIAALPSYNTPVINVFAALPGASPETMATSVALQLEKQFQTIPGLNVISSTNTLGNTSITLEFDEGRNIDAASVDVQAALLRAQRSCRRT
jgi:hypothetical protein